jgi:transposase
MVAHLKLLIAKMKRDRKLLDQLEMQLEEKLETAAAEDEVAADAASDKTTVRPFPRAKPVRGPLPAHLPRDRVVLPSPTSCPCCGGKLAKLGETITETLESIPRTYKVIQTVREKFSCRSCETITQPPAPFHPIARGRAGPDLPATIVHGKFGEHQPLNRIHPVSDAAEVLRRQRRPRRVSLASSMGGARAGAGQDDRRCARSHQRARRGDRRR